jgi:catechol 2,3-dioxygenase-like lactoylglutathione lyase family enzyme
MPRVVGIDHLVLSVGNFARSKAFYDKLLRFLGFKRKYDYAAMTGWSNGKTLFWITAADAKGRNRKYRKGDIGFHHYAFELASRDDVDALGAFLQENRMQLLDPPGEYYGRNYYAVYFADPDGMKLEGMVWKPPKKAASAKRSRAAETKKPRTSGNRVRLLNGPRWPVPDSARRTAAAAPLGRIGQC